MLKFQLKLLPESTPPFVSLMVEPLLASESSVSTKETVLPVTFRLQRLPLAVDLKVMTLPLAPVRVRIPEMVWVVPAVKKRLLRLKKISGLVILCYCGARSMRE